MISIDSLFSNCFSTTDGDEFLFFSNQDRKAWIVPSRKMRVGLALYQPGGIKGVLLKTLLPFLYWIPGLKKVLRQEKCSVKLHPGLEKLISSIFKTKNYSYSFFSGTPCAHQKTTIQIFDDEQILGYVKCSFSDEVTELFNHECEFLNGLNSHPLRGRIPQCLYCGTLSDGLHVFVQSTIKTLQSRVVHEWAEEHELFVSDMEKSTSQFMLFEETELYSSIRALEGYLRLFSEDDQYIVSKGIQRIKSYWGGREVSFFSIHGDFTPWNMFVEKGRLFVFDFEYAGNSYPSRLDRFHFLVQTGIFEQRKNADLIYQDYLAARGAESHGLTDEESDIHFLSYLIDILSRFVRRGKGEIEGDVRRCAEIWLSLMNKL